MLCPTVDDERGLFWVGLNELELLGKEFDLKYLEETPEPKEKEFFIDKQGRKQPVLSNPLKFTNNEKA